MLGFYARWSDRWQHVGARYFLLDLSSWGVSSGPARESSLSLVPGQRYATRSTDIGRRHTIHATPSLQCAWLPAALTQIQPGRQSALRQGLSCSRTVSPLRSTLRKKKHLAVGIARPQVAVLTRSELSEGKRISLRPVSMPGCLPTWQKTAKERNATGSERWPAPSLMGHMRKSTGKR